MYKNKSIPSKEIEGGQLDQAIKYAELPGPRFIYVYKFNDDAKIHT
jgi:hypothetical protein